MGGYYLVLDILLVLYEFSCNSDLVINSGLFVTNWLLAFHELGLCTDDQVVPGTVGVITYVVYLLTSCLLNRGLLLASAG